VDFQWSYRSLSSRISLKVLQLCTVHNKENDEFKNKSALENGYSIIRICQEIVLNEKEDWENQLINIIKLIDKKVVLCKIGTVYKNIII
jgi:hypothetical protein